MNFFPRMRRTENRSYFSCEPFSRSRRWGVSGLARSGGPPPPPAIILRHYFAPLPTLASYSISSRARECKSSLYILQSISYITYYSHVFQGNFSNGFFFRVTFCRVNVRLWLMVNQIRSKTI